MVIRIVKKGNSITQEPVTPSVVKTIKKAILKPLSPRDQKLVNLVVNGSKKAPAMIKVGYSPNTARAPGKVFDKPEVANAVSAVVAKMEANRNRIIDALTKKDFEKQSPFNLTAMMNMHTKDVELLSGRPTDRTNYTVSPEEKARLDKLLALNRKKS